MENLTEPVLIEKSDLFDIYFVPLVEYSSLSDALMPEDVKETAQKIDDYDLVYFCAKVYAKFEGNEISSDYLGQCIYESYEDFYTKYKDADLADMVSTVKGEGIEYLQNLKKTLNNLNL